MTVTLALIATGLVAPYLLRRFDGRAPSTLVVAAQLGALALVWVGLTVLGSNVVGLTHRFAEFCAIVPDGPSHGHTRPATAGTASVLAVMLYRSLREAWRTASASRRVRKQLTTTSVATGATDVSATRLGSVACTIGLLRPHIFVDHDAFRRLTAAQRAAVLEHERSHVRARHGLIDLMARSMAAGLTPLPGAATARREVRRHLEALADDHAAARTSCRTVAAAIVAAADAAAADVLPAPALGTAGWSLWRVNRMLDPRPRRRTLGAAMATLVAVAGAALAQTLVHMAVSTHLIPIAFPVI